MNQKFQYKTVVFEVSSGHVVKGQLAELDETLHRLGEDGWGLVSVWPVATESKRQHSIHYFEKELDGAICEMEGVRDVARFAVND